MYSWVGKIRLWAFFGVVHGKSAMLTPDSKIWNLVSASLKKIVQLLTEGSIFSEEWNVFLQSNKVVQLLTEGQIFFDGSNLFTIDPMWSLCIVESLQKFSTFLFIKQKSCITFNWGTDFFRGENFFYDWPYMESVYSRVTTESFNSLPGQTKKLSNI